MNWLASIFTGLLSAAASALLGGFIANLAVGWHRIPSREGASGFFVLYMGLFAGIGGLVIGIVCSRLVAPGSAAFFKGLGLSLAVCATLIGILGTLSRLMAHVPPTLDGDNLQVEFEVRLPETQAHSPALDPGEPSISLNALIGGRFLPELSTGPLRPEHARNEGGRWILPGALDLATERGRRLLTISLPGKKEETFEVPLPRRPGRPFLEWSDWLPRPRPDGQPPVHSMSFRYRIHKSSEALYWETVGPFEIGTVAKSCGRYRADDQFVHSVRNGYRIRHAGKDLEFEVIDEHQKLLARKVEATQLCVLRSPQPAVLVTLRDSYRSNTYIVSERNGQPHLDRVDTYGDIYREIAPDPAGAKVPTPSRIDMRRTYPTGDGLILISFDAIVDPLTLTHRSFKWPVKWHSPDEVHPIAFSPDRTRIVRWGYANNNENEEVLVVLDTVGDGSHAVPIDPRRMRYVTREQIDHVWVNHHFEWVRDEKGGYQLVERKAFTPLPHAGEFKKDIQGYRTYHIHYATAEVREELGKLLEREFKAVRDTTKASDYAYSYKIGEHEVSVSYSSGKHGVVVFMAHGVDTRVVEEIARRFDRELATGRYDEWIVR